MKTEWLNNSLMVGPHYCLCLTEKAFNKELKKLGIGSINFVLNAQSHATMHEFESKQGNICCIVCMHVDKERPIAQVYGLLVHEAVHIWQSYEAYIGERNTSREFEAYSIQCISQQLMQSYMDQTK